MSNTEKINVLFVCSGNVFRSPSAERLLKSHLADIHENCFVVKSAGTTANPQEMRPSMISALDEYGIDVSDHKQSKLTAELVDWADTIIAMSDYHQQFIAENFGAYAHLYNDFAYNEETNVGDIEDKLVPDERSEKNVSEHVIDTIQHLHEETADLAKNLQLRHFLFAELASGERTEHMNGAPFEALAENEQALAFLSLDIPAKQDGHILVIPKERYPDFHEIPADVRAAMVELSSRIGEVLNSVHAGYNLLLNNGAAAQQYIYHAHLHLIPRDFDDNIQIEVWKHHHETPEAYLEYHNHLKELLTAKE